MLPLVAAVLILAVTIGAVSTKLECFPVARRNSNRGCFLKKIVESKSDPKKIYILPMVTRRACCLEIPAISIAIFVPTVVPEGPHSAWKCGGAPQGPRWCGKGKKWPILLKFAVRRKGNTENKNTDPPKQTRMFSRFQRRGEERVKWPLGDVTG